MMEHVKAFSSTDKLTKSVISILVGLAVDKNDLQLLKIAFKQIDSDHDGKIAYQQFQSHQEELKAFGIDEKWKEIFKKADLNKKEYVSYMDFIAAATDHKKVLTEENIKKAFDLFDLNNQGVIDIGEFSNEPPAP